MAYLTILRARAREDTGKYVPPDLCSGSTCLSLAAVAQQLSTLTFRGPGRLSAQAYRERLDALAREQERLEGELSARSAAFRQGVAPITLDGVRQGLPADAALVVSCLSVRRNRIPSPKRGTGCPRKGGQGCPRGTLHVKGVPENG